MSILIILLSCFCAYILFTQTHICEYSNKNTVAGCPFCEMVISDDGYVFQTDYFIVRYDSFPVSDGHMLIIPKRHVKSCFDLTSEEAKDLMHAIQAAKQLLDDTKHPDGYNVGFNDQHAGGQTVMHAHVHIIPRYNGDVDDPRGGVRGVIPKKQKYSLPDKTS